MHHSETDLKYCRHLHEKFYRPGSLSSGGVTRLGYSKAEDEMHRLFAELAGELGAAVQTDEAGNTFAACSDGPHVLMASHLDSVVEGGRYDGVAGVMAGLLCLKWANDEGLQLPLQIGAFRSEESSNFGICTIGSGLVTGKVNGEDIADYPSQDGVAFRDIFSERGYSLHPAQIEAPLAFLELHIEQGKVLDETGDEVGIVTDITGFRRYLVELRGSADHSGATPMDMRQDALCAAAEIILAMEKLGRTESVHHSVSTVGIIHNVPNVLNVIPGHVRLGIDNRSTDDQSLDRMEARLRDILTEVCSRRAVEYTSEKITHVLPVKLDQELEDGLASVAEKLGLSYRRMPSGAGHDAMCFPPFCPTAMVFVPCDRGISHNPLEYTSPENILDGARVIYQYLKENF